MKNYRHTIIACYIGYVTQAIVCNFAPLLFLTFRSTYGLSIEQVTLMISLNFLIQFSVDFLSAIFIDKIGYRPCIVAAHVLAACGLVGLTILPEIMPPYAGLLTSTVLYAIGGGLLEVIVSPLVEACPTDGKSAAMSFLHSFYSWGCVAVIVVSTIFFSIFGIHNWRVMAYIWAAIPVVNAMFFTRVPIAPIVPEGKEMTMLQLFKTKLFWILMLLMTASGAAELAVAQWASAFAESGLKVSKTVGDLTGACMFAVMMGLGRVFYGKFADRIDLEKYIMGCGGICVVSYLLAVAPVGAVANLIGCALTGLGVGIVWPGMLSVAAVRCPRGGTAMFALLALGGDIGCFLGPTVVGMVSGACGDNLKIGILAAVVFPLLIIVGMLLLRGQKKPCRKQPN